MNTDEYGLHLLIEDYQNGNVDHLSSLEKDLAQLIIKNSNLDKSSIVKVDTGHSVSFYIAQELFDSLKHAPLDLDSLLEMTKPLASYKTGPSHVSMTREEAVAKLAVTAYRLGYVLVN